MSLGLADWLRENMLECPNKAMTGYDCPGCGMQRSFIALIEGHLVESFLLYPPLIPIMVTLVLLVHHLLFKRPLVLKLLLYSFYVTAGTIFINFAIKYFFTGLN